MRTHLGKTKVLGATAEALIQLEQETARVTDRLHRDTIRRHQLLDEVRRARASLSDKEARRYDALREVDRAERGT